VPILPPDLSHRGSLVRIYFEFTTSLLRKEYFIIAFPVVEAELIKSVRFPFAVVSHASKKGGGPSLVFL